VNEKANPGGGGFTAAKSPAFGELFVQKLLRKLPIDMRYCPQSSGRWNLFIIGLELTRNGTLCRERTLRVKPCSNDPVSEAPRGAGRGRAAYGGALCPGGAPFRPEGRPAVRASPASPPRWSREEHSGEADALDLPLPAKGVSPSGLRRRFVLRTFPWRQRVPILPPRDCQQLSAMSSFLRRPGLWRRRRRPARGSASFPRA
jgi:hypothetical protein